MASSGSSSDQISPEETAYWYFRLNGFLQIQNWVMHPDPDCIPSRNQAKTEADLIGIRMPWRNEQGMPDDASFKSEEGKALILFTEVTAGGKCKINGPWTDPSKGNLKQALTAIGCVNELCLDKAVKDLYSDCVYSDQHFIIRMAAIGDEINPVLVNTKAGAIQITWDQALRFIHMRFTDYRVCKENHERWPRIGHMLWEISQTPIPERFVSKVLARFMPR